MVERSLCMREAVGSNPTISRFFVLFYHCSVNFLFFFYHSVESSDFSHCPTEVISTFPLGLFHSSVVKVYTGYAKPLGCVKVLRSTGVEDTWPL